MLMLFLSSILNCLISLLKSVNRKSLSFYLFIIKLMSVCIINTKLRVQKKIFLSAFVVVVVVVVVVAVENIEHCRHYEDIK